MIDRRVHGSLSHILRRRHDIDGLMQNVVHIEREDLFTHVYKIDVYN